MPPTPWGSLIINFRVFKKVSGQNTPIAGAMGHQKDSSVYQVLPVGLFTVLFAGELFTKLQLPFLCHGDFL